MSTRREVLHGDTLNLVKAGACLFAPDASEVVVAALYEDGTIVACGCAKRERGVEIQALWAEAYPDAEVVLSRAEVWNGGIEIAEIKHCLGDSVKTGAPLVGPGMFVLIVHATRWRVGFISTFGSRCAVDALHAQLEALPFYVNVDVFSAEDWNAA
jgi:hypothetical protein